MWNSPPPLWNFSPNFELFKIRGGIRKERGGGALSPFFAIFVELLTNYAMKVTISTLAGTKNCLTYEGKEVEMPCVPQIGSVIEFGDAALEVAGVFYTYKDYGFKIYVQVKDWR